MGVLNSIATAARAGSRQPTQAPLHYLVCQLSAAEKCHARGDNVQPGVKCERVGCEGPWAFVGGAKKFAIVKTV
jgi:hypothetical protein